MKRADHRAGGRCSLVSPYLLIDRDGLAVDEASCGAGRGRVIVPATDNETWTESIFEVTAAAFHRVIGMSAAGGKDRPHVFDLAIFP